MGEHLDLQRDIVDALIEPAPVADQVLDGVQQARREHVAARGENIRQRRPQPVQTFGDGDTAVEQEGADLVDNRRTLADQVGAHPMQGLQVELLLRLGRDEAHGRALHGLGDGFRVAEVVLVALEEGLHVSGRHQSRVVAECFEPPAQVVGTNTGLHADEAGWQVGEPCFELSARQLMAQHDGTALAEADEVEGVLADVDTEHGDGVFGLAWHGGLLAPVTPLDAGVLLGAPPVHAISRLLGLSRHPSCHNPRRCI